MVSRTGKNIFDIWKSIGQVTPFAVRKWSWSNKNIYVIVQKVEPEGRYGKAYGYVTENGVVNDYFNYNAEWRRSQRIPNSGIFGWEYVEGVSLEVIKEK